MAVRVPDILRTVDPAETHDDYFFDHLFACVKKGQAPGELWCPRGVALDSNSNQIYVSEGNYISFGEGNIARVSIFSEMGEFVNMFSHPDMKYPYSIAVHRDNMYVTDLQEHSIFHFKESRFRVVARVEIRGSSISGVIKDSIFPFKTEAAIRLESIIGNRGSGIGQFNWPVQLAVSLNGDVFVADFYNNRVQILDGNLHYQRHLSLDSSTLSRDIKLTQDEVYILCRRFQFIPSSPCIKVFS